MVVSVSDDRNLEGTSNARRSDRVRRVAPRMVRVVLGGDGLDGYEPTSFTDQYVNALFVPPGAPYAAPFDVDEARRLRAGTPPRRTALHDPVMGSGRAGRGDRLRGPRRCRGRRTWANNARVGEVLQFVGPTGGYAPDDRGGTGTCWWATRARCPPSRRRSTHPTGSAGPGSPHRRRRRQRDGPRLQRRSPGPLGAPRHRRRRGGRGAGGRASRLPAGRPDVFVHGEAGEVRAVRRHLLAARGLTREGTSILPTGDGSSPTRPGARSSATGWPRSNTTCPLAERSAQVVAASPSIAAASNGTSPSRRNGMLKTVTNDVAPPSASELSLSSSTSRPSVWTARLL